MEIRQSPIPDAMLLVSHPLRDDRGDFSEFFRFTLLAEAGHPFRPAQTNVSTSRRDVLRGLHGVRLPPGQAKIVTCHRGAVLDMVVDLRAGSPTYGEHWSNVLDAASPCSVFIAEGLAHGFLALTDDAAIGYLCSSEYVPGTQVDIDPFDPDLRLPWNPARRPILSAKDTAAPSLAQVAAAGLLPSYEACRRLYANRLWSDVAHP